MRRSGPRPAISGRPRAAGRSRARRARRRAAVRRARGRRPRGSDGPARRTRAGPRRRRRAAGATPPPRRRRIVDRIRSPPSAPWRRSWPTGVARSRSTQRLDRRVLSRLRREAEDRPGVIGEEVARARASVTSRPRSRIATRSQTRSTSDRTWVEMTTVVSPRSPAISSRTSRRPSGSSELTGSSRNTIAGRWSSAWAIPSRCRIPPE